jgi:hypothetical protein
MNQCYGRASGCLGRLIGFAVIPIFILNGVLRPLYRPLVQTIARLRLLTAISVLIRSLPAYAILCVLAVPFAIAEPLKILALYWIGTGHLMRGAATLVIAYGMSFVLVERIYDAGSEKLLGIPWFSNFMQWVLGYRKTFLEWLRATEAWRWGQSVLAVTRQRVSRLFHAWCGYNH